MIEQATFRNAGHGHEPVVESYYLGEAAWKRVRNSIVFVALASWIALLAGYLLEPKQFFFSYLFAFVALVSIGFGAMFFTMVQHLTGAAWSVTVRRFMESITCTLQACVLLFIPVVFGLHDLYPWTHPAAVSGDPLLAGKAGYLNSGFFLIRAAGYFILWSLLSWVLYRRSVAQDYDSALRHTRVMERVSGPGVFLLFVTATLASFDWVMSLEPRWYSTIFGVYVLAGGALGFFAVLILIALAFRGAGYLRRSINDEHYHDLGKWLFAMVVFWAYIAFSQYMLIWYTNLPEETFWFKERRIGSWMTVSLLLVFGHFLVPLFVLVSRAAKRNLKLLGAAAVWLLIMHFTDVYFMVMPVLHKQGVVVHWLDLAALAGVGSVMALWFWGRFRRTAIVPVGDPRLEECLHFHNS